MDSIAQNLKEMDFIRTTAESLLTKNGFGRVPFKFNSLGPYSLALTYFDLPTMLPIGVEFNLDKLGRLTEAGIEYVLLHEVAHLRAGYEAAHGALWQAECFRLGIDSTELDRRTERLFRPVDRATNQVLTPVG